MKIMIDLNVLVDVLQQRKPFLAASAKVCAAVAEGEVSGSLPAHAVTTIFYLVRRNAAQEVADRAMDWLLRTFDVAPLDKLVLSRARNIGMKDFEDAVVVASAENEKCDFIVTRNIGDFSVSPVKAIAPEEFLELIQSHEYSKPPKLSE